MKKMLLSLGVASLFPISVLSLVSCKDSSKFDFTNDKHKFVDATSSKDAIQLSHDVISLNPTAEQLGFLEPKLSHDTYVTYSISSKDFSGSSSIIVNATLTNGEDSITIPFHLTAKLPDFDFSNDKMQIIDAFSTKDFHELNFDIKSRNPTALELGYIQPILSHGTTASYSIEDMTFDNNPKTIAVLLTHGLETATTTFRLTPAALSYDFSADLAKFISAATSKKTVQQLNLSVNSIHPSAEQLGFTPPQLSDGTTASYLIDNTKFNDDPKEITVNLFHGIDTDRTIFNLTPKAPPFNFAIDKAKFISITSDKTPSQLNADVHTITPTAKELGFIQPILSNGTTATYKIENATFDRNPKRVTIIFKHLDDTDKVTFNLVPAFDFTIDKAKFIDAISTKTKAELNSSVNSKNPTAVDLGYEEPILTNGVTATYSIISTKFDDNPKEITVVLHHGLESNTTTFNLKSIFDFTADKIKFIEAFSNKNILELNSSVNSKNPTAMQLGYEAPILSHDTTATYSITSTTFDTNPKEITVTLLHDGQSSKTTFYLKPRNDINTKKAILNNLKLPIEIKLMIGSTPPTGITTYVEAKQLFDAAQLHSMSTTTNEADIDKAIIDAKKAIVDANAYNQKALEANGWLKLEGTTKTLISHQNIYSMIADGNGGFWVGGGYGKLDHIDANGNHINSSWRTKTLLTGLTIRSLVLDGHGGLWVGGTGGLLEHVDSNGEPIDGYVQKTLLGGAIINSIISDGNNGFWVGGDYGKLDHIDANGNFINSSWITKRILSGSNIYSMIADGNGGFWVCGGSGKLDHIDANGNPINSSWTTKKILSGNNIYSIISDGNGGFWVGGGSGKLDHIDANGNPINSSWTTKTLLDNKDITSIISDGHGGFFVGGNSWKLDHINQYGDFISSTWTTKEILVGSTIKFMVSSENGKFLIAGTGGRLIIILYNPTI